MHEREEREPDQDELRQRARARQVHPAPVSARRTDERHAALDERDHEGEDEREMAEFGNHCAAAPPPRHWPDFLSASTTSGGM